MSIKAILDAIEAAESSPLGRSVELRVSFSRLVTERLRELGWTQKKLAEKTRKKESYISRVLNGDENCSFDRAAELLFILGTEAEFRAAPEHVTAVGYRTVSGSNGNQTTGRVTFKEISYGQSPQDIEWTVQEIGPKGSQAPQFGSSQRRNIARC